MAENGLTCALLPGRSALRELVDAGASSVSSSAHITLRCQESRNQKVKIQIRLVQEGTQELLFVCAFTPSVSVCLPLPRKVEHCYWLCTCHGAVQPLLHTLDTGCWQREGATTCAQLTPSFSMTAHRWVSVHPGAGVSHSISSFET